MIQKQGECLICGSSILNYDSFELEGESVMYPWTCEDCGSKGKEVYELSFVGHEEVETN